MNEIVIKRKTMVEWNCVKSIDTFCYRLIYNHILFFLSFLFFYILESNKSMINWMIGRFDILVNLNYEEFDFHFIPVCVDHQYHFESSDLSLFSNFLQQITSNRCCYQNHIWILKLQMVVNLWWTQITFILP